MKDAVSEHKAHKSVYSEEFVRSGSVGAVKNFAHKRLRVLISAALALTLGGVGSLETGGFWQVSAQADTGQVSAPTGVIDMRTPEFSMQGMLDNLQLGAPLQAIKITDQNGIAQEISTQAVDQAQVEANQLGRTQNYQIFTKPMQTQQFAVAALVWDAKINQNLTVIPDMEVRVHNRGGWGDWWQVEAESAPEELRSARAGTEPFLAGAANGIQVRVSNNGKLPVNLQLLLYKQDFQDVAIPQMEAPLGLTDPAKDKTAEAVSEKSVNSKRETNSAEVGNPQATNEQGENRQRELNKAVSGGGKLSQQVINFDFLPLADSGDDAAADKTVQNEVDKSDDKIPVLDPQKMVTANSNPSSPDSLRPNILTRAGWERPSGLVPESGDDWWEPEYYPLEAVIVHHTAGRNDYLPQDSAAIVRGIYRYHAVTREWGDIGYNFLVDRYGRIYEGREGTLAAPPGKMVQGAHAAPRNKSTVGISVMGNFIEEEPPAAALASVAKIIAWQFKRGNLDPLQKTSGLTVPSTRMGREAGTSLPRVLGHKDVAPTACPGKIYDHLADISQRAAYLMQGASAAKAKVMRLQGVDRVGTSMAAWETNQPNSKTVILAGSNAEMDALSVVPLAKSLNAPVVYTKAEGLSSFQISKLSERKVSDVILAGGVGSISNTVVAQLQKLGVKVMRLGGKDRFETAFALSLQTMAINNNQPSPASAYSAFKLANEDLKAYQAAKQVTDALVPKWAELVGILRQNLQTMRAYYGSTAVNGGQGNQGGNGNPNGNSTPQNSVVAIGKNAADQALKAVNQLASLGNPAEVINATETFLQRVQSDKAGGNAGSSMVVGTRAVLTRLNQYYQENQNTQANLQNLTANFVQYGGLEVVQQGEAGFNAGFKNLLVKASNTPVFLTPGLNFADALSAGPAAAKQGAVILLTGAGSIPAASKQLLDSLQTPVVAVGGDASRAVAASSYKQRVRAQIVGKDRYHTSALVNQTYFANSKQFALASGQIAADAVIASAFIANRNGGVLLTEESRLPFMTAAFIGDLGQVGADVWLFGGNATVQPGIEQMVRISRA